MMTQLRYLHKALEIEIDNVNHLIQEQRKLNSNYMNGVKVVEETEGKQLCEFVGNLR